MMTRKTYPSVRFLEALLLKGPQQALSLPKGDLQAARNAGYVTESRDVYGYLTVTLSPAGYQHLVSPAVRTEAVVLHLLPNVRKVTPDGRDWPVTPDVPAPLIGHVRKWLAYADSNHACNTGRRNPRPRENGKTFCCDRGWLRWCDEDACWKLSQEGVDAAVTLHAVAVTPLYRVTDPVHATQWVDYELANVPLPQLAVAVPVARNELLLRVEKLEATVEKLLTEALRVEKLLRMSGVDTMARGRAV